MALHLFALVATILAGLSNGVSAQRCYYPNGDITTVDAPCPNSDLCCPLNWQCLSNGLCYDPTNDYYERRTCTDSRWRSEDCPDFCTYSDAGNEAILLCASGEYCCDGNRVSFDCCDGTLPPGTDYFKLPDGNVVGSITFMGPAATSSTEASSSSPEGETSSTSVSSATTSSGRSSTTMSLPDSTTTSTSSSPSPSSRTTSTASNGTVFTVPVESAQPDKNSGDDRSFSRGAIIGLAIGVSVLFILCALMLFILYRRHKRNNVPRLATYSHTPSSPTEIKYSDALAPGTRAPEIDSSPKAPTGGTSELYGSDVNVRSSTVSSMTAGAQGYSPTSMVSPVVSTDGGSGGGGVPGRMGQIEEKDEPPPAELWGGHVYRPYRPGMESQSGHGITMQGQGNAPAYGKAQAYEGT